jgi:hypothetical protein
MDTHALQEQLNRIYRATHDGTVDIPTIDDALQQIGGLIAAENTPAPVHEEAEPKDKHHPAKKKR